MNTLDDAYHALAAECPRGHNAEAHYNCGMVHYVAPDGRVWCVNCGGKPPAGRASKRTEAQMAVDAARKDGAR